MKFVETTDNLKARNERLISDGEKLNIAGIPIEGELLKKLTGELISIYDNPFNEHNQRERACHVVSGLTQRSELALELVFKNAQHYVNTQYVDDASPYSPNSFDVLSVIGKGNPKVISFLELILKNEWGIPRWAAIKALGSLNDPLADGILSQIEKYPPKFLDQASDLAKIRQVKGWDWMQSHYQEGQLKLISAAAHTNFK